MPRTPMCYRRNFLSKVLLRVDFTGQPFGTLAQRSAATDAIAVMFPHVESKPMFNIAINFTDDGIGSEHLDAGRQWTHSRAVDGTVVANLTPTFFSLEYGPDDYRGFEAFFTEFKSLFESLQTIGQVTHLDRIGLRYINEIRLPGRALEWGGLLRDDLIAAAVRTPALPGGRLLRSMHQMVEQHQDDHVLFNYGIVNPDFPSPAVQRHFILDIDCYRPGVIIADEAMGCVQTLNALATDLFESSVGDDLRNEMGIV